jgi:hypothetical protein
LERVAELARCAGAVSDLDPSGLDLQRAWEKALENFGVFPVFERLALTDLQVSNGINSSRI